VNLLATMGTDLSLQDYEGGAGNAFDYATICDHPTKKAAVLRVFKKHGVTGSEIPKGFQSPLYFKSVYYAALVKQARWKRRGVTFMCMNFIHKKFEQKGEKALKKLKNKDGLFFFKCFTQIEKEVGAANRVGKLILCFAAGVASDEVLRGVPVSF
jgi:hypothetical protein